MEWNNTDLEDIANLSADEQLNYEEDSKDWISGLTDEPTTPEMGTSNPWNEGLGEQALTIPDKPIHAQPVATDSDSKRRLAEEGFRANIYTDTEGYLTVGIGHKLTKDDIKTGRFKNGLTREQAIALYHEDEAREQARLKKHLPNIEKQPEQIKGVLKDMAFNLGGNFLGEWRNFKKQINAGDYKGAAANIRKSRYYKQVPNRAERNAKLIESLS